MKGASSRADVARNLRALEKLPLIDVRDFIVGESDVDIVCPGKRPVLDASAYGLRKIDMVDARRLNPHDDLGRTERDQGYIPIEKIRLARNGIIQWEGFGNGPREILDGKLTVHFSPREVFEKTHYAKQGLNHPALLALRYLRLVAMHYFYENGNGYPDKARLSAIMADGAAERVRRTLEEAKTDKRFHELLRNPRFVEKVNQTIEKAFRSYTSPTAAHELYKSLGAKDLIAAYGEPLKPINQFLFAKHRDAEKIQKRFEQFRVDPTKFFVPVDVAFPGGKLHHGTPTEEGFRDILFGGILPSTSGSAGQGLYGVANDNLPLCTSYAGGDANRIVVFNVSGSAKIVNVREGEGRQVFEAWSAKNGADWERFAEEFGIDIVDYPYSSHAYVVKNSTVLERPEGYQRKLMSFGKLLEAATSVTGEKELKEFMATVALNRLSLAEKEILFARTPYFATAMAKLAATLPKGKFLEELKTSHLGKLLAESPTVLMPAIAPHITDRESFLRLVEAMQILTKSEVPFGRPMGLGGWETVMPHPSMQAGGPRFALPHIFTALLAEPSSPNAVALARWAIERAAELHDSAALEAIGPSLARLPAGAAARAALVHYIDAVTKLHELHARSHFDRDSVPSLAPLLSALLSPDAGLMDRLLDHVTAVNDLPALRAFANNLGGSAGSISDRVLRRTARTVVRAKDPKAMLGLIKNFPPNDGKRRFDLAALVAMVLHPSAGNKFRAAVDALVERVTGPSGDERARRLLLERLEKERGTAASAERQVYFAVKAAQLDGTARSTIPLAFALENAAREGLSPSADLVEGWKILAKSPVAASEALMALDAVLSQPVRDANSVTGLPWDKAIRIVTDYEKAILDAMEAQHYKGGKAEKWLEQAARKSALTNPPQYDLSAALLARLNQIAPTAAERLVDEIVKDEGARYGGFLETLTSGTGPVAALATERSRQHRICSGVYRSLVAVGGLAAISGGTYWLIHKGNDAKRACEKQGGEFVYGRHPGEGQCRCPNGVLLEGYTKAIFHRHFDTGECLNAMRYGQASSLLTVEREVRMRHLLREHTPAADRAFFRLNKLKTQAELLHSLGENAPPEQLRELGEAILNFDKMQ